MNKALFFLGLNLAIGSAMAVTSGSGDSSSMGSLPLPSAAKIKPSGNKSYALTCKSTTCSGCISDAGTYAISGTAYFHTAAWSGASFYINGYLVDSNSNFGDQQGTGYAILTGNLTVNTPSCVFAQMTFGYGAWGDYTINLVALPR